MRRHTLVAVFSLTLGGVLVAAQSTPPPTAVRDVTDTYFGTPVVDHYRYLEDLKNPEVVAWFKAQGNYTRGVLDAIPGREKLFNRIRQLDTASASINLIQVDGGRYFYLKQLPEANNRRLCVREGLKGTERVLLDPETLTAGPVHYSIDYFYPSLDGKLVAVGISPGGSEDSVMRIIETDTGRDRGERIDLAQFGAVNWLPDGKSFFYNRRRRLNAGEPDANKYLKTAAYLHAVGTDPKDDRKIAGMGMNRAATITETDLPVIWAPPESTWAFLLVSHGVQPESTLYFAPLETVRRSDTPWKKLVDVEDQVTSLDVRGNDVYFLTHKGASRFKIVRVHLPEGSFANPEVLLHDPEMVLRDVRVAKDAVYVPALDGGLGRIWRIPYGGKPELLVLPVNGAVQDLFTDLRLPGMLTRLASWTVSPLYYQYDPASRTIIDTALMPRSPVDFSGIEAKEVKAKAKDGTDIPLSIVYKRGIKLDGSHPTLLEAYGAYGITVDPFFDPKYLAWLERGGVIAEAHVRGGGEYGEDWHLAGKKSTKQNTISDFIACAEYLVKQGYTSPTYLAGEGTSAGGITIGGAITQRPELFAAAIDNVGMSDDLRAENQVNGAFNTEEFGTVKDETDFRNLLKISAYQRIEDKTAYPAVLLTTGINDSRVDPWQMAKMTARLQAASSSGKPILLRVDYDAGHGGVGATRMQVQRMIADKFSFLLWQLGDAEFQPSGTIGKSETKH